MDYNICPRVKKYEVLPGTLRFTALRVFSAGESDLFFSSMKIFQPDLQVEKCSYKEANIRLSVAKDFSPYNEYCNMRIREGAIEIHCADRLGARNASAILAQLLRKTESGYVLDCADVEDWPDAQYRCVMEESSGRVWVPMETLKRHIREMGLCRYNAYMFHYMEDEGCTIPFDCLPNLIGYGPDNLKFTKQEIKDMIAYAAALGIRVIPFIEVISHAKPFALAAGIYCPGDPLENMYDVCLGQEKTFEVIEKIIQETVEMFPDEVIHIGADEYDMSLVTPFTSYWDKCPHCLALAKEKGFTTLREMFMYGLQRVNEIVNSYGKIMMIWNADLRHGYLPDWLDRNILVHYYRYCNDLGREDIYNLNINGYAEDGFSVINSFSKMTYIDFYTSALRLYNWSYKTLPMVNRENYGKVPGGCLCIWEEHEHYRRTIAPGIALFADRLWNGDTNTVTYDDNYGKVLTKVIFEGRLPENTNIFACLGDVLPPLDSEQLGQPRMVTADEATMIATREALAALGDDEQAEAYIEAIDWMINYKKNERAFSGPRSDRIEFVD